MKLPVGSKEREEKKLVYGLEIIKIANRWERSRGEAVINSSKAITYHNYAEKLARAIRRWRRL